MAFSSTTTTIVAVTLLLLQTSASMAQQRRQSTFLFSLCDENAGKYTIGTIFSSNLNLLLTILTSGNLSTIGHFVGDIPYRVYGLVVCSDDVDTATCRTCLSRASQDVKHRCPFRKAATVWYDKCQLRYSNSTFNSPVDESNLKVYMVKTSRISTPTYATQNRSPVMAPPTTSPTNSAGESSGSGKRKLAAATSIAYFVVIIVSLLFFLFRFLWRRMSTKKPYPNEDWEETLNTASLLYNLQTVRKATNNFSESNKLGEGGFGPVYKGKLEDGQEIAVKRLSATSGQGLEELRNEVVLLARVQHRKLVRLLGICLEEVEKLLVYEYMPNRSLDTILFDVNKNKLLCWKKRYNIIEGVARGLLYLHEESQIKVIHRDLKASNVLLDANMDPKISDFGMARLFGGDQTQAKTKRVVGTFGYMSPEYAIRGHFSSKSDVFSFGVLVLEIVTGRRNADYMTCDNSAGLLSQVWEHWSSGTASELVDPSLGGNYTEDEALRCIEVGLHCVQQAPSARPTMSAVLLMLNSKSEFDRVLLMQPPFPNGINRGKSIANEGFVSRNHISITVMDPR